MHMRHLPILMIFFLASCAGSEDVFPSIILDTTEAAVLLPNPISILADEANSQILVANSNVDIFFDTASLAVLNVDSTDPLNPQLSAAQIIEAPNFAGEMVSDGVGSVYIPFRQETFADSGVDIFRKYTLSAGALTLATEGSVADNPFGISLFGGQLYVVSDDLLEIYDTSLTFVADVDLTTAESADLEDTDSEFVQDVVVEATGARAVISNSNGEMFVIDLATQTLIQAITGPLSTRDLVLDGALLYALDANARLVWIFDLDLLSAASATPEEVDDSSFLVATVSVGTLPAGMVLDTVNSRLYVANSFDDTISVIDTLSYTEIARVSLDDEDLPVAYNREGRTPSGLTLGTFGGRQFLLVACLGSNAVALIDTLTLRLVELYPDNALQFESDEEME